MSRTLLLLALLVVCGSAWRLPYRSDDETDNLAETTTSSEVSKPEEDAGIFSDLKPLDADEEEGRRVIDLEVKESDSSEEVIVQSDTEVSTSVMKKADSREDNSDNTSES